MALYLTAHTHVYSRRARVCTFTFHYSGHDFPLIIFLCIICSPYLFILFVWVFILDNLTIFQQVKTIFVKHASNYHIQRTRLIRRGDLGHPGEIQKVPLIEGFLQQDAELRQHYKNISQFK